MQRDLEYTYAVYQHRSFSKAAKFLYASQPAVSLAVQRVEEDLGYPVFDRQAHPLQMTEAGESFIRHVERIRESERILRSEIDALNSTEGKCLRIGCSPLKATYLIPEIISRFHRLEPDVDIALISSFRRGMLRDLTDHKVDMAINTFVETDHTAYTYLPACETHYLLCVPAAEPVNERLRDLALTGRDVKEGKHLLPQCTHIPITMFTGVPFVSFAEGSDLYEQSRKIFDESGFAPDAKITVTSPVMAYELAAKGAGMTIVADYMVGEEAPLLYYHLRTRWERREFFFVLRREDQLLKHQKLFIDILREYMNERGQEQNP